MLRGSTLLPNLTGEPNEREQQAAKNKQKYADFLRGAIPRGGGTRRFQTPKNDRLYRIRYPCNSARLYAAMIILYCAVMVMCVLSVIVSWRELTRQELGFRKMQKEIEDFRKQFFRHVKAEIDDGK
jgi:hypothetical protein